MLIVIEIGWSLIFIGNPGCNEIITPYHNRTLIYFCVCLGICLMYTYINKKKDTLFLRPFIDKNQTPITEYTYNFGTIHYNRIVKGVQRYFLGHQDR